MKKLFTSFLLLVASASFVFSQHEFDKWIFGNGLGIDFTSGTPTVISSTINGWDNTASIADSLGNLLFFTNGEKIYDKNGNLMPNGNGLYGDSTGGNSATILKQPGNDSLYYVFTNDDGFTNVYGFGYSVVNMNLNGGLGDVVAAQKNVPVLANNTEKVVPILHGDGTNIWIVTHENGNNTFRAYLLTPVGFQTTPIVSSVGSSYTGGSDFLGQLTVNKQGNRLAVALYSAGKIELLDFNNYLGFVSNPITITGYNEAIGIEFSPDGSKLYETGLLATDIVQFDLSTYTQSAIANSATTVGIIPASWATYRGGYMQLGPDDKIYVVPTFSSNIGVIANPNTLGNGCNYNGTAINLSPKTVDAGLVSKIGVPKPSCVIQIVNEIKVVADNDTRLRIYPNPTNGLINVAYANGNLYDIAVYDVEGKLISEKKGERNTAIINVNGMPRGTYLIKITDKTDNTEITKRVVLQ